MLQTLLDIEQQRHYIPQMTMLCLPAPVSSVGAPSSFVGTPPDVSPQPTVSPETVAYYQRRLALAKLAARAACYNCGTPDQAEVIIKDPCLLASYVPLPDETECLLPVQQSVPYWFRIIVRPNDHIVDLDYAAMARTPHFMSLDPVWAAAFTQYAVLSSGGKIDVQQETVYMVPKWLEWYAYRFLSATGLA